MGLRAIRANDSSVDPLVSIRVQALDAGKRILEVWIDVGRLAAFALRIPMPRRVWMRMRFRAVSIWMGMGIPRQVRMRMRCRRAILGMTVVTDNSSAVVVLVRRQRQ